MTAFVAKRSGKLLLLGCSIAISFVVAEVVLRIYSAGYLLIPIDGHPVLHHVQPSNLEFTSYNIAEEFGGHSVIYDKDGFRVPHHEYAYDNSLKDVVFLGDSFVEASEVPYEQTFVSLFAEEFENFNARNFGVSSYSPLLSYLQLKHYLNSIKPVLVVHLVFENDLEDDRQYYSLAERENGTVTAVPGEVDSPVRRFLRQFYVARLVHRALITVQALAKNSFEEGENKVSLYLDDPDLGEITPYYINKISQLATEHNIRYLLMCVPSKLKFNEMREHNDICKKIKKLASDSKIEYVDLDSFFSNNADGEKPFFDRNIHLNATGHRLTHLALINYLKSNPQSLQ